MRNMEQVALLFVIHAKEKKVRGQGSRGEMFWLVAPFWCKFAGWRESYVYQLAHLLHMSRAPPARNAASVFAVDAEGKLAPVQPADEASLTTHEFYILCAAVSVHCVPGAAGREGRRMRGKGACVNHVGVHMSRSVLC